MRVPISIYYARRGGKKNKRKLLKCAPVFYARFVRFGRIRYRVKPVVRPPYNNNNNITITIIVLENDYYIIWVYKSHYIRRDTTRGRRFALCSRFQSREFIILLFYIIIIICSTGRRTKRTSNNNNNIRPDFYGSSCIILSSDL